MGLLTDLKLKLPANRRFSIVQKQLNQLVLIKWFMPVGVSALIAVLHIVILRLADRLYWIVDPGPRLFYFDLANYLFQGLAPYRDFFIEYPPGALYLLTLPRLITSSGMNYQTIFLLMVSAAQIGIILTILAIDKRLNPIRAPKRALAITAISLVLALGLGPISWFRFDVFVALSIVLALMASLKNSLWQWFWLALGTTLKIIPAALVPIFLAKLWGQDDRAEAFKGLAVYLASLGLIITPLAKVLPQLSEAFAYQLGRGLQIESLGASITMIWGWLKGVYISSILEANAFSISPYIPEIKYSLLALFFLCYILIFWRTLASGRTSQKNQKNKLIISSLALIALILSTGNVLSPQFFGWLIPLMPLVVVSSQDKDRPLAWLALGLALSVGVLTQLIYPRFYFDILNAQGAGLALIARNGLLALVTLVLFTLAWGGTSSTNKKVNPSPSARATAS